MKTPLHPLRRMAGFTLVEIIIVIVVTGILAAVVAIFIRAPVEGYFASVRRAELTDRADVALRRITRDVRLALPNSLRVSPPASNGTDSFFIEFIMTSAGGRYRDPADGSTGGNFLNFANGSNNLQFDVHGTMPAMSNGDFIVVYNLGPGYAPADAYSGGNRATINAIAGNTVTLVSNPFLTQSPPLPSPQGRFQVVPAGVQAVSYRCRAAALGPVERFANYGFLAAQPTPPGGTPALLVDRNAAEGTGATCLVSYAPAVGGRHGLLDIQLTLAAGQGVDAEIVTLQQQIRVDNAP